MSFFFTHFSQFNKSILKTLSIITYQLISYSVLRCSMLLLNDGPDILISCLIFLPKSIVYHIKLLGYRPHLLFQFPLLFFFFFDKLQNLILVLDNIQVMLRFSNIRKSLPKPSLNYDSSHFFAIWRGS